MTGEPPALWSPDHLAPVTDCMLCGSEDRREMFREDPFGVFRCSECSLVYVTPRLKPEILPRVYDEGYWRSESPGSRGYADYRREEPLYLKTFRKRMELVDRFHPGKGRALDVGCAAGYFMKVLQEGGWEVEGVEPSREIAEHAKEAYGFTQVHVGELGTAPYAEGSFDLISLWDVVEHLPEPMPFLEKAATLMKRDGILILETQNVDSRFARLLGRKWQHFKHLEHLYHFNPKTIRLLLERSGFDILWNTSKYGGKHVSVGFVRERATRVHGIFKLLFLPLAPLNRLHFYVNLGDEMVIVARRKGAGAWS